MEFVVCKPKRGSDVLHVKGCRSIPNNSKVAVIPFRRNKSNTEFYDVMCACVGPYFTDVIVIQQEAAREWEREHDYYVTAAKATELERIHPLIALRNQIADLGWIDVEIYYRSWSDRWLITFRGRDDWGTALVRFWITDDHLDVREVDFSSGLLRSVVDVHRASDAIYAIQTFKYVRGA